VSPGRRRSGRSPGESASSTSAISSSFARTRLNTNRISRCMPQATSARMSPGGPPASVAASSQYPGRSRPPARRGSTGASRYPSELAPVGCQHSLERGRRRPPHPRRPGGPGGPSQSRGAAPDRGGPRRTGDHHAHHTHAADRRQRHRPVPGARAEVSVPRPARVPPGRLPRGPRRPRRRDPGAGLEALRRAGPAREEARGVRDNAGAARRRSRPAASWPGARPARSCSRRSPRPPPPCRWRPGLPNACTPGPPDSAGGRAGAPRPSASAPPARTEPEEWSSRRGRPDTRP
jgi:hypothetical protein